MSFKTFIDKAYKTLFINADGKPSLTKAGLIIGGIGTGIAAFPASMAAAGITVAIPPLVILGAKYAAGIGVFLTGIGGRNALDKNAIIIDETEPNPPVNQ